MKKIILSFLMAVAMTSSLLGEQRAIPLKTHENGSSNYQEEPHRTPICLPLSVSYDSDTRILEVWCADDNIQAEVYVYDESDAVIAYSPRMNAALHLTSSTPSSIILIGDGWEAEGRFQ